MKKRSGGGSQKPFPKAGDSDLKALIHGHSVYFDHLVELIPARFYLPADEDKPWFQGLSKTAKVAAKKESRQNLKKARRARLDPEKSATTLDLLKKSIFEAADKSSDGGSDGDEAPEIDENLSRSVVADDRSITYEELQQRLHRRIEELRSNRNSRPSEKKREKKEKKKNKNKNKNKKAGEEAEPSSHGKRKREESEEEKGKKKKAKPEKGRDTTSADLTFGQVKIGGEDDNKKKKRKLSKQQALERAKKLDEAKKDPEKGEKISKKHSWKAAVSRAAGVKVHDDPKLLKESIKKEKKRQQKHAEKWKERMESVGKLRAEKQKKRTENIKERIHQKKMRRIEKREKKLMRPGFEGRKEGYINE
ncbi:ribosomal RNA-processing protein 14-C [Cocos nucifera]|uniref:Ribosomal RNA-processing protein 14-C n=1 Tax=Cocos nucifera TaxID=13894 RepID=A0A8K0IFS3_COCNU|nr:ribosomal RNA-processing protein 14-C [Cocos nucifera]